VGDGGCTPPRLPSPFLTEAKNKAALVANERSPDLKTIWELIMLWYVGASVAVTFAMLVALAIIFWVSRKLD